MKKLLSIAAAGLLLLSSSFQAGAIEGPDPVGSVTANALVGLAPGFGANASIDYVLVNKWWMGHFTVGAYAGFHGTNDTNSVSAGGVTVSNSSRDFYLTVMPRATYGLNITDSFEVHAGTMLGVNLNYNKTKDKVSSSVADLNGKEKSSDLGAGLAYSEIIGCRYFLSDHFGLTAEVGYGSVSYLNVGFSYRF
jgi:hypothetical protein